MTMRQPIAQRMTTTMAGAPVQSRRAFTLVELLTVVGIIGLLVAILLPALAGARRTAVRTACMAKLHQIMLAAELHTHDHQGFYPLAGEVPSRVPEELDDAYAQKYDYLSLGRGRGRFDLHFKNRKLAALPESLSVYMGYKQQILIESNTGMVDNMYDRDGFLKNFVCPAQAADAGQLAQSVLNPEVTVLICPDSDPSDTYREPQSYVYNEAVLGFNDEHNRLRGKAVRVRRPSVTVFAADGINGANRPELGDSSGMLLYNKTTDGSPVTLADALTDNPLKAGDSGCFDKARHSGTMQGPGKINVACCDGHVETRDITPADLGKLFLVAP